MENKWIPVSKELPEEGIRVLLCYELGEMACGWNEDGNLRSWDDYICFGDPIAWMYLPEQYEEEEEE